ncbi:MAG: replication initiator protein A [Oscillospiraceae bacterium]|nr:replication initiator protein A [Oscillospiraceae bacterium]
MTADTRLPSYLPYPRFLLGADLTQTAKLIYAVLLDRANLSKTNGWIDEDARVFLMFPITEIANTVDRSPMTVKNALTELETAGLIERRRGGFSMPNRIYVKLPDGQDIVRLADRKLPPCGKENCPTDGQKTVLMTDRKLSPNNMSNSNLKKNNIKRVNTRGAFGRYENVLLTDTEYQELAAEIPMLADLIEELSSYMKSKGTGYADHAATLRRWAQRDKPKRYAPDYSCKEDESL